MKHGVDTQLVVSGRPQNRLGDLVGHLFDVELAGAQRALVGERRAVPPHLLGVDLVPDGQHGLLSGDCLGDQPVQFVICPALGEE